MPSVKVTRVELAPVFKEPRTLKSVETVLNGAIVGGESETGAQVPTLGAAMPGTLGGDPVFWVPVVWEGVECLMPLWRRDPP